MIDRDIKIGTRVTCSDTLGYDDFSIVIDKLDDTILVENQQGEFKAIDFRTSEAFFWYECNNDATTCRISQHDFVNRIRESVSTLGEMFTDEGLIALHGSLYSFYRELITKDFDVESLLSVWEEFDSVESAEAHTCISMELIPDLIIKFEGGVLVQVDEI